MLLLLLLVMVMMMLSSVMMLLIPSTTTTTSTTTGPLNVQSPLVKLVVLTPKQETELFVVLLLLFSHLFELRTIASNEVRQFGDDVLDLVRGIWGLSSVS
jgi:hypothetical protein